MIGGSRIGRRESEFFLVFVDGRFYYVFCGVWFNEFDGFGYLGY